MAAATAHGEQHLTTRVDPAGWWETHTVFLDPAHPAGDGETLPASICVDYGVDLSPQQGREVAARLVELADIPEAG